MKNYMLLATAISFIGTGTLLADDYQQGKGYNYPSSYKNNTYKTQEYDTPPHHFNPQVYGTEPSHPKGYVVQSSSASQGQSYFSQPTETMTQPNSAPQDMRSTQEMSKTQNMQNTDQKTANRMVSQGVVRGNDDDKFTTDEDRRLGFQIRQQIAEKLPQVDSNAIAIYIDEGSVRLSGKLPSEEARSALSNLVKELKGVKSVSNKVEVPQKGFTRPVAANERNSKSPSYTSSQQKNTYSNSTSNWSNTQASSTNLSAQDSQAEDKIRQAIASDHSLSPQSKSIGILVDAKTITLNGIVKSEVEKSRIAAKVRGLSEGRIINNMLEVLKTR
ncbi:hypothetical protein PHSC3_001583 [Chlamydiales bacterium STE3]|nr:hypothetical protein PHSC3_001583 [Chlamydiales bacterium STE3]